MSEVPMKGSGVWVERVLVGFDEGLHARVPDLDRLLGLQEKFLEVLGSRIQSLGSRV